jgi:prevent-host-death family protein
MKGIDVVNGVIPLGDFKANASRFIRDVRSSDRPLLITQNGKPAAVLLSPETYEEIRRGEETRAAVARGTADLDAGRVVPGEDVERWLASWGTADELPPPG